tara:strand:- start:884 stop:1795 length:912 start_codon:yes stop_codon:yes gene_type:complete
MQKLRSIAVVGSGVWAQRHMAAIKAEKELELAGVVSRSLSEVPRPLLEGIGELLIWPSLEHLLASGKSVDGIALIVEPSRLRNLCLKCIDAGLPVLSEKPLTLSSYEANEIQRRAKVKNLPVFVNLIYLFSAGYRELYKRIQEIEPISHIQSVGGNNGPLRRYMSGLWDYGPHELSMVLDIVGEEPTGIETTRLNGDAEVHTIRLEMSFESGKTAELIFGNLMSEKRRYLRCIGARGTLELLDYPIPSLKRDGVEIPFFGPRPLASVYHAFIKSFVTKEDPLQTLALASRINGLLEQIDKDLK